MLQMVALGQTLVGIKKVAAYSIRIFMSSTYLYTKYSDMIGCVKPNMYICGSSKSNEDIPLKKPWFTIKLDANYFVIRSSFLGAKECVPAANRP